MDFQKLIEVGITAISALVAVLSIVGAMKSGVLRRLQFGSIAIEASPQEREQIRALVKSVSDDTEAVPFETEQLALYYGQILSQSKISFWFSLVFASLGFVVIIISVFLYSSNSTGTTIAQFAAGTIMDAVAALFFVQSRNAQKSMGEFFDKLRRDRNHLESRKLCSSIETKVARDALKIQLSLHYAEVPNSSDVSKKIIDASLPTYQEG